MTSSTIAETQRVWATLRPLGDCVLIVGLILVVGLFRRFQTGVAPYWYPTLEKMIAGGFMFVSFVGMFVLPISWTGVMIYGMWYLGQLLLYIWVPGPVVQGYLKVKDKPLQYKCNGFRCLMITFAVFFGGSVIGLWKASVLADHFVHTLAAANIWSNILSILLLVRGKMMNTGSDVVTTGSIAQDFWYGMELNPMIRGFDLKFFSESRPGLILWALIVMSIGAKQIQDFGTLTGPLACIILFQVIYVVDYFVVEQYILSTIDIIHERFGWMLVWGDYVWVPYFYVLQAWYMYTWPRFFSNYYYATLCLLTFAIGYTIFRGANRQKHKFKEDPAGLIWGKPAETVCNGRLLVSGWWGLARHINYLGDLIVAIAWGLPCGIESYIPYLYFLFMLGLLFHRFARDDKKCAEKYGPGWNEYCEKVPYKMIPFVV